MVLTAAQTTAFFENPIKLGGPRLIQEARSVYLLSTALNMQEMSTDF